MKKERKSSFRSRPLFLVALLGAFLPSSAELAAQGSALDHDPVWVPKAVQLGETKDGKSAVFSSQKIAGSDYDGDGYPDIFLTSDQSQDHIKMKKFRGILYGRGLRIGWAEMTQKVFRVPALVETLLQRGPKLEFLISKNTLGPERFFPQRAAFPSFDVLGSIPLPPAPRPYRLTPFFHSAVPVGDLDGDGYQELLGRADGSRVGVFPVARIWAYSLLDGKSLTLRWQAIFPRTFPGLSLRGFNIPLGDADGDGVLDIAVTILQENPLEVSIRLLSGADGHAIWNQRGFPEPKQHNQLLVGRATLDDLDGDGIRDLMIFETPESRISVPGALVALSGRTGEPLWKRAIGMNFPDWGEFFSSKGVLLGGTVGSVGDVNEDGVSDFLVSAQEWKNTSNVVSAQWLYSGRNGDLLAREGFPRDFLPWFSIRNFFRFPSQFLEVWLDDVDHDGWAEIGTSLPRYDSTNNQVSWNLVILGRRTLWTKPKARPGEVLEAHLWIPTGAGKTWRLFGSTGFRNDGTSLRAGVWDTHLAQEDLLHNPNGGLVLLSGTLDAAGKADFQLPVPPDRTLSGKVLYFMAVVDDPAQPDGVLTLSTLAQVHVR